MDDGEIIRLFELRDERAIPEIKEQYGRLMVKIAENITGNPGDAEECLNDSLLGLWNAIPPAKPENLRAYACKTARTAALKRLEYLSAGKRRDEKKLPLSELEAVLGDERSVREADEVEFRVSVDGFLEKLSKEQRTVFLKRYFFYDTVPQIAGDMKISEAKVKSMLHRLGIKFREYLKRSEIYYE